MNKPLIIVHGKCFDGFTSAWIAYNFYIEEENMEPEIYEALYGADPPDVTGREVFMFDFSYKRSILLEMKNKAKNLQVFDHHKTSKEDLAGLDFCYFDDTQSGAQLAWQYFYGDIPEPLLVSYVADRDLWKFQLPNSKEINAFIGLQEMTFKNWDMLSHLIEVEDSMAGVIGHGKIIIKYREQILNLLMEQAREIALQSCFGKFTHLKVLVANAPYTFASDLGHKMAISHPSKIGISWFQRKDGKFQYSFRSEGDVDVQEIAKTIGGGGHRNAAGAESDVFLF